jgi:hypothetical protein
VKSGAYDKKLPRGGKIPQISWSIQFKRSLGLILGLLYLLSIHEWTSAYQAISIMRGSFGSTVAARHRGDARKPFSLRRSRKFWCTSSICRRCSLTQLEIIVLHLCSVSAPDGVGAGGMCRWLRLMTRTLSLGRIASLLNIQ